VRFWAFLGKGGFFKFKNTTVMFLQITKSPSRKRKPFPKKTKVGQSRSMSDVSFSSFLDFFVYRVFGCFSAMGVQTHYKKRFTKRSCRKVFTKDSTKNPKPIFSRFFYHVFGRFSVRGVQKHDQKNIEKINLTLSSKLAGVERCNIHSTWRY
jgi:hypothetical protein